MTDRILPTEPATPFARKGEASPSLDRPAPSAPPPPRVASTRTAPHPKRPRDAAALGLLIRRRGAAPGAVSPGADRLVLRGIEKCEASTSTPTVPLSPSPGASPAARATGEQPRRQLTVRLPQEDFERLRIWAAATGSTYQDILASAARQLLQDVALPPQEPPRSAQANPWRRLRDWSF